MPNGCALGGAWSYEELRCRKGELGLIKGSGEGVRGGSDRVIFYI